MKNRGVFLFRNYSADVQIQIIIQTFFSIGGDTLWELCKSQSKCCRQCKKIVLIDTV